MRPALVLATVTVTPLLVSCGLAATSLKLSFTTETALGYWTAWAWGALPRNAPNGGAFLIIDEKSFLPGSPVLGAARNESLLF